MKQNEMQTEPEKSMIGMIDFILGFVFNSIVFLASASAEKEEIAIYVWVSVMVLIHAFLGECFVECEIF